jgi:hypothetical protein
MLFNYQIAVYKISKTLFDLLVLHQIFKVSKHCKLVRESFKIKTCVILSTHWFVGNIYLKTSTH